MLSKFMGIIKNKIFRARPKKAFVFTCAYNAEKTIARTIESVLNQTFKDFDYFIVDNGSTDATSAIISEYAASDNRIYKIQINHNDLRNYKMLLNLLTKSSNSKYCTVIDADDVMHGDFLETMITYADDNDLDIVACGYNRIDGETGRLLSTKQSDGNFVISGDKFKEEFIRYRGYTPFTWGKLYKLDFRRKWIVHGNAMIQQASDSISVFSLITKSSRFGVIGKAKIDYYIYRGSLSGQMGSDFASLLQLYIVSREYIASLGQISVKNENFLFCIYLSLIDEFAERVFTSQFITNAEKYEAIHSILTNEHSIASFSFSAEPEFIRLAEREKWLGELEEKVKRFSLEYPKAFDTLPLIENLRQAIPKSNSVSKHTGCKKCTNH